jgi:hypothetical protein
MATITFSVELINELTGHSLNFEYDWEEYGLSKEEAEQFADDLASGRDMALFDEILNNVSIIPTVENVEVDDESD